MIWTPIIAMVCITGLEVFAISQGINGATFGIVLVVLAGLGGYEIKSILGKRKGGE